MNKTAISRKRIRIDVDLLDAALAHRQFLKVVDEHPCLYAGPHVQNAIRRYELLWLPLVAQTSAVDLAAPIDIAWVWHVHMLSPLSYERDCNEIVSSLVDHKILMGQQREKGFEKARNLWTKMYPNEPFEVDLKAPAMDVPYFKSRIQYDIAQASRRQRVFYYQVSLPHYGDKKFLRNAIERYKQHLLLKQKHQEAFLVPCYDFDLIWHAHQVHPVIYRNDTIRLLGRVLKHDDSVNDRRPGSKLTVSDQQTRQTWSSTGVTFELNGAMFRGEPPEHLHLERADYSSLASREYTVDLVSFEVEGLPKPKSYMVQMDVANGERVMKKKVEGPAENVRVQSAALSSFSFCTWKSRALKGSYLPKWYLLLLQTIL